MGHQFTIESDEIVGLATELAALTGESVESAVARALREQLKAETERRRLIAEIQRMTSEFRATLTEPLPTSDHSWLYDEETGLPI